MLIHSSSRKFQASGESYREMKRLPTTPIRRGRSPHRRKLGIPVAYGCVRTRKHATLPCDRCPSSLVVTGSSSVRISGAAPQHDQQKTHHLIGICVPYGLSGLPPGNRASDTTAYRHSDFLLSLGIQSPSCSRPKTSIHSTLSVGTYVRRHVDRD